MSAAAVEIEDDSLAANDAWASIAPVVFSPTPHDTCFPDWNRTCGLSNCWYCRERLGLKRRDALAGKVDRRRLLMVTLTTTPSRNSRKGLKAILDSFSKLTRQAWWKLSVKGGFRNIHGTLTPNGWAWHIHAVVESSFINARMLRDAWQKLSGASDVHVQSIVQTPADRRRVIGYALRPGFDDKLGNLKFTSLELHEYRQAAKGIRLYSRFGSWSKLEGVTRKRIPSGNETRYGPNLDNGMVRAHGEVHEAIASETVSPVSINFSPTVKDTLVSVTSSLAQENHHNYQLVETSQQIVSKEPPFDASKEPTFTVSDQQANDTWWSETSNIRSKEQHVVQWSSLAPSNEYRMRRRSYAQQTLDDL